MPMRMRSRSPTPNPTAFSDADWKSKKPTKSELAGRWRDAKGRFTYAPERYAELDERRTHELEEMRRAAREEESWADLGNESGMDRFNLTALRKMAELSPSGAGPEKRTRDGVDGASCAPPTVTSSIG